MKQRIMVVVGIILLAVALGGIWQISQSGLEHTTDKTSVDLSDLPDSFPGSEPVPMQGAPDLLYASAQSRVIPLVGGILAVALGITLGSQIRLWAYSSGNTGLKARGRGLIGAVVVSAVLCLIACGIVVFIVVTKPGLSELYNGSDRADVRVEWPRQMDVTDSAMVRIDWIPPEPGTSDVFDSMLDRVAAEYEGSINATLSGSSFEITPDAEFSGWKPFDAEPVFWLWEVRPQPGTLGPEPLKATITVWLTPHGADETVPRTMTLITLESNVTDPILPVDHLLIMTMAAGMLGAGLCGHVLNELIRQRAANRNSSILDT